MNNAGKLPPAFLERLVLRQLASQANCHGSASAVAIGAGIGEDAAVLRMPALHGGDALVVVAADPITGAEDPRMAGALAVYVNANDVLVQGGVPSWMTLTLLVPVGTSETYLGDVITGVCEAAERLGIVVVGGHTEVTESVQKAVVCGTLLGALHPELKGRQVPTGGMRVGDKILLTKSAGLEGTAILLNDRGSVLCGKGVFSEESLKKAKEEHPLEEVSVHVEMDALLNSVAAHLSAMHDPTEGGIANALHEMCGAAGPRIGVRIERHSIPIAEDTVLICRHFGVDPMTLISSGCVLAAVDPNHVNAAIESVKAKGVACAEIGVVVSLAEESPPVCFMDGAEIACPEQDSLWSILASTL